MSLSTHSRTGDPLCGGVKHIPAVWFSLFKETAVPMALTTAPDAPSRSKHCR